MGIERDYLMRQLMILFDVIEKIIRYRKKGENRLAEDEIEYFYSSLNIESEIKLKKEKCYTDNGNNCTKNFFPVDFFFEQNNCRGNN